MFDYRKGGLQSCQAVQQYDQTLYNLEKCMFNHIIQSIAAVKMGVGWGKGQGLSFSAFLLQHIPHFWRPPPPMNRMVFREYQEL